MVLMVAQYDSGFQPHNGGSSHWKYSLQNLIRTEAVSRAKECMAPSREISPYGNAFATPAKSYLANCRCCLVHVDVL